MTPIPNFSPSWVLLALGLVLLIAVVSAARRLRRGHPGRWDVRVCDRCGAGQPPHAAYCRQCGMRLN